MKRYLPFVIVIGVALVTLGSGTMLYRAKRPQLRTFRKPECRRKKRCFCTRSRQPEARFAGRVRGFPVSACAQFAGFTGNAANTTRACASFFEIFPSRLSMPRSRAGRGSRRFQENFGRCTTALPEQLAWSKPRTRGIVRSYAGTLALIWISLRKIWTAIKRGNASIPTPLGDSLGISSLHDVHHKRPMEPHEKNPEVSAAINAALSGNRNRTSLKHGNPSDSLHD